MSELQVPIRIKRGVGGAPSQLLRGELAYAEDTQRLYVGEGASGSNDPSGRPIALTVRELTTPPSVLSQLSDVVFNTAPNDGDVLTYDGTAGEWIAQAIAASSVAWADITGKPSVFTPDTHTHAWGDITSGVPSTFAPSTHASSHATGGADAIAPADIGAAAASHTHSDATTSVAGFMSAADKTKLDGVASGATANTGTVTSVVGGTGLTGGTITATGTLAVSYGTTAGTACEGNDARLSDSRTPTSHTHAASDITSGLATVATTGAYSDLSGTPTLATVATTGAYSDLSGTPTLGTAAASATTDFAAASHTHSASDITSGLATVATTGAYSDLSGTPTLGTAAASATSDFAAASHSHAAADITSGTLDIARIPTGSTSSTVCIGDDARLTNNRDPNSHTHGNITDAGAIGSTSGLPVKTGTSGVLEAGAFGTSAGEFAEGNHTHAWTDITSKPSDFTPSAHNHTVTLEISGFIEAPEAKTYVLSPSIPAAITITNVKAKTGSGTCDIKLQDDGVDISDTSINDVSTSVSSPASEPSATVASGSVLALVVSDLSSGAPEDLAFSVHYTVASANNA